MIKVSIILPSLNVVSYIRECLESVINQTLPEIEIICVDAGSTDGTLEIIEECARSDERIKILRSERKSYGYQMNCGIREAGGEYIGIVETDDFVPPDMYEELYKKANLQQLDLIKADFFRFTSDKDGNIDKKHIQLTSNPRYIPLYNQVLAPIEYLQTFTFAMNTWSGIYNRDFLLRHNIWHNESAGASFQDNGFWFQTLMHAKRALFTNKPFYMNRRDNPDSSVYSKSKVYAICEEYKYIYDILSKDRAFYEKLIYVYTKAKWDAYFFNLTRIGNEFRLDFLEKMSTEFIADRDKEEFDTSLLGERWAEMLAISEDAERYFYDYINAREVLVNTLRKTGNVIIYGAGAIGKQMLSLLTYNSNPVSVLCFAVTDNKDNQDKYLDIPIIEIKKLIPYKSNSGVLIATTQRYTREIRETLEGYGFTNIYYAPAFEDIFLRQKEVINEYDEKKELLDWYWKNTGKKIDLLHPKTMMDKIQWQKLYGITPRMGRILDRVDFLEEVKLLAGEKYLPEIYGIWSKFSDIDMDLLPDSFQLMPAHCIGGIQTICDKRDKSLYNFSIIKKKFDLLMKGEYRQYGFNLYLKDRPRVIVARELLKDIFSYQVICEDGKARYIYLEKNTLDDEVINKRRSVYDTGWKLLDVRVKYAQCEPVKVKPLFLDEMLEVAEKIAAQFKVVGIRFKEKAGNIIIDEITNDFDCVE